MKYFPIILTSSALTAFFVFFQAASPLVYRQENCYDKFRWKYEDYTSKPLAANQLLTAAYTIYVDFSAKEGLKPEGQSALTSTITSGFQTAMMNWTSTLVHNRSELSEDIRKFIDDHTFVDGNKRIWNPPQVLPVECPQDANFIIRVFLPGGKRYIDKSIIATAQIKGRTITLNMQNFQFVFKNGFFELQDGKGTLNIVPVIAHELGHSFGLKHVSKDNSVMNGSFDYIGRFPSLSDGMTLASALTQKTKPSQPGYLNPTECAGLKFRK